MKNDFLKDALVIELEQRPGNIMSYGEHAFTHGVDRNALINVL